MPEVVDWLKLRVRSLAFPLTQRRNRSVLFTSVRR